MERSTRKDSFFPARCPGCEGVVHLLVGSSVQVTVQIHNVRGCSFTLYYRCWIEQGLPLPRVEFFDAQNATHFTLHPHTANAVAPTTAEPCPPPSRPAQFPVGADPRRARASAPPVKARGRRARSG